MYLRYCIVSIMVLLLLLTSCSTPLEKLLQTDISEGHGIGVYNIGETTHKMYMESGELKRVTLTQFQTRGKPSTEEVLSFLFYNDIDKLPYVTGYRECGFYAREIYEEASSKGYKVGFVVVKAGGWTHTFNVWSTSDAGLFYTDSTNGLFWKIQAGQKGRPRIK